MSWKSFDLVWLFFKRPYLIWHRYRSLTGKIHRRLWPWTSLWRYWTHRSKWWLVVDRPWTCYWCRCHCRYYLHALCGWLWCQCLWCWRLGIHCRWFGFWSSSDSICWRASSLLYLCLFSDNRNSEIKNISYVSKQNWLIYSKWWKTFKISINV